MCMIKSLAISDVKLITPKKFCDERGFFSETYNQKALEVEGISSKFVQDNHSLSRDAGTVRGLHIQAPPFQQMKLVRVLKGSIYDVAVDLRKSSPTFGKYVHITITSESWSQILIPAGFAHGFMTLEPDTEVFYKVDNFYSPGHDCGVIWDDPDIGVEWPIDKGLVILSVKDQNLPRLKDLRVEFL